MTSIDTVSAEELAARERIAARVLRGESVIYKVAFYKDEAVMLVPGDDGDDTASYCHINFSAEAPDWDDGEHVRVGVGTGRYGLRYQ